MDPVNISKFQITPITTGKVVIPQTQISGTQTQNNESFADVLKSVESGEVQFSKHASQRLSDRNITLDSSHMNRLNDAVKLASDKGLRDTLVVMDKMAFIVNIPGNKVITTMNGDEVQGNVFTNIDGAVII